MAQHYSDPTRADDTYALPNIETFYLSPGEIEAYELRTNDDDDDDDGEPLEPGWYWHACFPGCLPDGEPMGPFATEAEAVADAQEGMDEDE